jgi:hypothetical protein
MYSIAPARHSRGNFIARCPSEDGFKTRAARLAGAIASRYTNRERMVAKGSTLASAARKCGLAYTTVWRALQRSGAFYKRRNVKP